MLAGSRVVGGYSVYGDDNTDDCFGHGTHVSGIVGGLTYGVAKNVTLVPGASLVLQRALLHVVAEHVGPE